MDVRPPNDESETRAVEALVQEYVATLPPECCPHKRPDLDMLLGAFQDGEAVGCAALRWSGEGEIELKRLYLRPQGRGQGAGRRLVQEALARARQKGARRVWLDTHPTMEVAVSLYRSLGFQPFEPDPPQTRGLLYFERHLA